MIPPLPGTTGTTTSTGTGSGDTTGTSGSTGSTGTGDAGSSGGSSSSTGTTGGKVCADVYDPVCGKDGKTYDNACTVPDHVEVRREGPCFGDCEGACTIGPPEASMPLALALLLSLRGRGFLRRGRHVHR